MSSYQVLIHALGALGEGIGTLEDGLKIFVEGALPGEHVEVTLTLRKQNYAKGSLVRVLEPSQARQTPPCPLFGTCGGCHLMHLEYTQQIQLKRQRVINALERIGKLKDLPEVQPCVASPLPLHYRNKIQLPVFETQKQRKIGLYRKNSHDIIDVPHCYIHNREGEDVYTWIREHLPHSVSLRHVLIRQGIFTHETLVILVTTGQNDFRPFAQLLQKKFPHVVGVVENINTNSSNTILSTKFRSLSGRPYFFESLLGKKFKVGPASFFQVNSWQAENLIQEVLRLTKNQSHEHIYDAYTGVGTFALFLADHAKSVQGTECVAQAIECAKENAVLNHITNCHFQVGEAKAQPADLTILNPPRKGCDPLLLQQLRSNHVIYISCDPATLARDLALLAHYQIESVTPFDLFPQTMHVETVVALKANF
ncbi:MAG: 23S rRNA (uracil(1939)-C(5))-methyltransferase RlmD [Verrucomicrobia bacterium]|nr:23S rRNA (uracil(1939)-C(5))-methyltransferase RlmD [Verrucomicrobiota bacterium]MBS0647473.1 23S rRNA (uracil(1939)-C(5))-methyltransferase RlmD [Verrucomicrobiota bacterium]